MQKRHAALGMFAVLLFSYVINAIDRQLFSVLAADVRNALDLSLPQVGLASTVFTLGMGVAGIPTGYLLGKMSRKSVTLVGLVIFSAATYLTAYSRGLPDLLLYRFVSGLGEAMQLTALLAIGTSYFFQHRAVAASSLNFTFGIGAIIGPNLGAAILGATHWKMPFIVFGLSGIVAFVLIVPLVKPWFSEARPQPDPAANRAGAPADPALDSLWAPTPLMLAVATAFAGLSIYGYLGLYPTYLRDALGFTPSRRRARSASTAWGPAVAAGRLAGRPLRLPQAAVLLAADLGRGRRPAVHRTWPFPGAARDAVLCLWRGHQRHGLRQSVGGHHQIGQQRQGRAGVRPVRGQPLHPRRFRGLPARPPERRNGLDLAGILQVSGCALLAALLAIMAGARRAD